MILTDHSHRHHPSAHCVSSAGVSCLSFHPDGLILGTGTTGSGPGRIRIWDMKSLTNVASFEGHTASIRGISFSENGFYMASVADDHNLMASHHSLPPPPHYELNRLVCVCVCAALSFLSLTHSLTV